jgi:hypothetical protein
VTSTARIVPAIASSSLSRSHGRPEITDRNPSAISTKSGASLIPASCGNVSEIMNTLLPAIVQAAAAVDASIALVLRIFGMQHGHAQIEPQLARPA